jgi:CTP-dependent riboflavin kinase
MTTIQKSKILRMVGMKPRDLKSFTEGDLLSTTSNRHIERYLAEMEEAGVIEKKGERWHITEAGTEVLQAMPEVVPSRIYTHAASTLPYVPPVWNVREGGNAHQQFRSRGV